MTNSVYSGSLPKQTKPTANNAAECVIKTVSPTYKPVYCLIKRGFDIIFSLLGCIVLLIPMLVIAVLIKIESPGPAIFRQKRMGQNGTPFIVYKFRTMYQDAPHDVPAQLFTGADDYVTKIGRVLRRTSLDELPQLLNVFKGNMSFVGYRPICLTETDFNDLRMRTGVFAGKPGITGLAQVSGRDNLSMEEKVELDARYVRDCSIGLDLWCLLKTVTVVITGEGVM